MRTEKQLKHYLVFLVEDNDMYSVMLDYLLSQEMNSNFASFHTGEECMRNLYMNPDIIIIDQRLPGWSGLDTFRKIRAIKPDVPVVIISSRDDQVLADQAIEEGVYEYVVKGPGTVKELRSIIEGLLRDKEPEPLNSHSGWKTLLNVLRSVF